MPLWGSSLYPSSYKQLDFYFLHFLALDIKALGSLEACFAHLGCFPKDQRAGTASPATSSPPACCTSSSVLFYFTFPPLGPCPGLV